MSSADISQAELKKTVPCAPCTFCVYAASTKGSSMIEKRTGILSVSNSTKTGFLSILIDKPRIEQHLIGPTGSHSTNANTSIPTFPTFCNRLLLIVFDTHADIWKLSLFQPPLDGRISELKIHCSARASYGTYDKTSAARGDGAHIYM